MPVVFLLVGVVLIVLIVMAATIFGGVGMLARGPKPSEGDDHVS